MDAQFPHNRFNFSNLMEHLQKEVRMPDLVTDDATGIEFYGVDTISKEVFLRLLEDFPLLDTLAQNRFRQDYEAQTRLDVTYFQFEPSWVEITPGHVVVGYVGISVNTDFPLTFSRVDQKWVLMDSGR